MVCCWMRCLAQWKASLRGSDGNRMNDTGEYRDGSLTFKSGIPVPCPRTVSPEKLRARMKRGGHFAVMNIDGDKNRVGFWRGSEYMEWAGPQNCLWFCDRTEATDTRDHIRDRGVPCDVLDLPKFGWWADLCKCTLVNRLSGKEVYLDGRLMKQSEKPDTPPPPKPPEDLAGMKLDGPYAVMNIDSDKKQVGFWRGPEDVEWAGPQDYRWFDDWSEAYAKSEYLRNRGIPCKVIDMPKFGWWNY